MRKKAQLLLIWIAVSLVLIALSATSCKTKNKDVERSNTSVDVTQQTTAVTTTVIDTTISLPGSVVTASEPLTQIVSGDTLQAENNGISAMAYYNKATGNLHVIAKVAPKVIPVQATKTQTVNTDTRVKAKAKEVVKKTEVKSDLAANVKIGIVLFIVCAIAGLFIYWRIKGLPLIS
jgi:hypothetical protein